MNTPNKTPKNLNQLSTLMEIVSTLRGPEGCPWDKEQTAHSLAPYAIEEIYEMVEAIESGNFQEIKEELGDVLFQVALQTQLAQEEKHFTMEDVLSHLNEKMIRRHPHVFSDVEVSGAEEVWKNWEKIKQEEKKKKAPHAAHDPFSSLPPALPALQTAYKIGVKTEKLKFDWEHWKQVRAKINEELRELDEILEMDQFETLKAQKNTPLKERLEHELGDVLFSVAQLARHLDIEPEQALRKGNQRFRHRFEQVLKQAQKEKLDWSSLSNPQKEQLWQTIKKQGF